MCDLGIRFCQTGLLLVFTCLSSNAASTLSYDLAGNQTSQQAAGSSLPSLLAQPSHQLTTPGGRASFSVVVASPAACSYQWRLNSAPIVGATSDSYLIPAAGVAHEGSYTVVVTNASGSVTSTAATLYIDTNDNGLPDTWEQAAFGNLNQPAMGDFDGDGVSNLDEYLEGTNAASNTSLFPRLTASGIGGVIEILPSKTRYLYGETVNVRALPHQGYGFFGWSGALTNAVNPGSVVMNASRSLGAVFSRHGVFAWGRNDNGELMVPHEPNRIVAVSAGADHTLALKSDGTVIAWGANGRGQTNVPAGLSNVVQVAAGYRFSMALRSDGTVIVWGDSTAGKTNIPVDIGAVVAISAGQNHILALRKDGTVIGWGSNGDGQADVPSGINTAVGIAAGNFRSMILKGDGTIVAWGYAGSNVGSPPTGLGNVVQIVAGYSQHYALKADGTVTGWGFYGSNVPPGLSDVVSIGAGGAHAVALKADGTIVTWGDNASRQRDIVPGINRTAAVSVGSFHNVCIESLDPASTPPALLSPHFLLGVMGSPFHHRVTVRNTPASLSAVGLPSGLAIDPQSGLISGTPQESGDFVVTLSATNSQGTSQKPLHLTINRAIPVITSPGLAVALASNPFSFAVVASNTPVTYQALGLPQGLSIDPSSGIISGTPRYLGEAQVTITATNIHGPASVSLAIRTMPVIGWGANGGGQTTIPQALGRVIALAGGELHCLAVREDGTVAGWGNNTNNRATPPSGLTNVKAVTAGTGHSVALREDGTVVAWGANGVGQATVPAGLTGVTAIVAKGDHTLALKADGTVVAWGRNTNGQATPPAGLNNAVAVAAGDRHSLAVRNGGTVIGWGYNANGQVNIPAGLTNVTAVAAGEDHSLALKSDGTVVGWGYNINGQAVPPAGLTNVVAISAGRDHSLALKADGRVVAWGLNSSGESAVPAGLIKAEIIAAGWQYSLVSVPSEIIDALSRWREAHFGTQSNTGNAADAADPDGDGLYNLIEFVMGTSPVGYNPAPQRPRLTLTSGGSAHFEYTLDSTTTALVDGVAEWSDTLAPGSWSTEGVGLIVLSQSGNIQSMRAVIPPAPHGRRFVRLRSFKR